MANLITANSKQNYFSFMDHIMNTRKGYFWDCPFPGLSKDLECKFTKSSSKSKI